MTRIGFAYNLKPESQSPEAVADPAEIRVVDGEVSRPDEEPPSSAAPGSDEFAEWDAAETIDAVADALSELGEVIRLEADESFPEKIRVSRPDIIFNIAEGRHGPNRESHVPAICEFFGIPYSGSDPFTLSLCLDKGRTKETLAFHGVPTAAFSIVHSMDELVAVGRRMPMPLFVKPVHEGSSKGITEKNFCRTTRELEAQVKFLLDTYDQPVLVEEYLPGDEFTCAVLGNGPDARVLPIVGMNFGELPEGAMPIYGYEAKWIWDRPEKPLNMFDCPARISDVLRQSIEELTLRAYNALGCRDWSRIDVRLDADGIPNVVEVNPLPGILPKPEDNSCLPKAARAAGIDYNELIQSCLQHAARREGVLLPAKLRVVRGELSSRPEGLERLGAAIGTRLKA
ncbi:MAG: D-alanine--D-alanine ligase [Gemmatimonadaceae bacterium]|nr:D-alanine--D-alanine ligase [Gemmatimonadaceae bacterium]